MTLLLFLFVICICSINVCDALFVTGSSYLVFQLLRIADCCVCLLFEYEEEVV